MIERGYKDPMVNKLAASQHPVFGFREPPAKHKITEQRDQSQGEQKRAHQRRCNRVGHRSEETALMALKRKDADVSDDDNKHRKERGPPNFGGRVKDRLLDGV